MPNCFGAYLLTSCFSSPVLCFDARWWHCTLVHGVHGVERQRRRRSWWTGVGLSDPVLDGTSIDIVGRRDAGRYAEQSGR